jgi:hypothetical protein
VPPRDSQRVRCRRLGVSAIYCTVLIVNALGAIGPGSAGPTQNEDQMKDLHEISNQLIPADGHCQT